MTSGRRALALVVAALVVACGGGAASPSGPDTLRVVTTTTVFGLTAATARFRNVPGPYTTWAGRALASLPHGLFTPP